MIQPSSPPTTSAPGPTAHGQQPPETGEATARTPLPPVARPTRLQSAAAGLTLLSQADLLCHHALTQAVVHLAHLAWQAIS